MSSKVLRLSSVTSRQRLMDVLSQCFEQDELFFGAGGSRRGTHVDDGLREDYFHTRLALLAAKQQQQQQQHEGEGTEEHPFFRPPEYFAARGALLRRAFTKRRTNRDVVQSVLAEQEQEQRQQQQLQREASPLQVVAPKPKRFKVADEYAFTGMHRLFDHHQTSVVRLVFAHGSRALLALGCADGSASVVSTALSGEVAPAKQDARIARGTREDGPVTDLAWSSRFSSIYLFLLVFVILFVQLRKGMIGFLWAARTAALLCTTCLLSLRSASLLFLVLVSLSIL
jgi:hypothetical protein